MTRRGAFGGEMRPYRIVMCWYDPPMVGSDERWMRRALRLAARGLGNVEPNPMVGCVLVRDGRVIGEGYHKKFGGPHAEVEALASAKRRGEPADGATVFVTLEPCCHHGKTPPCTDALIAAKVGRVVAAMTDPFEKVSGRGVAALREAGITVDVGLCGGDSARLNERFVKRVTTGLPWVTLKWAQSLDGRIAAADGSSRWISGESARAWVHGLRGRVDAVMIGVGTALADNPQLTARTTNPRDIKRIARRVVIDPSLRLPETAALLQTLKIAPLTIVTSERASASNISRVDSLRGRGVEVLAVGESARPESKPRLDLRAALRHLAQSHGATHVLVEGGATLAGSLLAQDAVDEVVAFVAPKLLGDEGIAAVRGLEIEDMAAARPLTLRHVERQGDDVRLEYLVSRK